MGTELSSFGQWLKRQRRAQDFTQEQLAERVGCALVTLRKIESGERRPSKEIAQRLAEALSVAQAEHAHFVQFARAISPDQMAPQVPVGSTQTYFALGSQRERLRPTHNLRAELTSFIGREREIETISQLLANTRLLTLTGAGGSGKTRLALKVASSYTVSTPDTFSDGVWLVDLARLRDSELVPQAIASGLGLRDEAPRPLMEQLLDYLTGRQLLLILDGCEHLITACAVAADAFLRMASDVKILATSREPLAIDGETAFRVPSLQVPDPLHLPPFDQAVQYEALRLFAERAAAVRPGFEVTAANAGWVAEICERLDGMPLAIELAAARAKVLSVTEIRERLADRFQLLTGGSRVALPRHQTLRATIEWSYGLLSEPERAVLRRLSVFAGGWTLEAAEAVCTPCLALHPREVDTRLGARSTVLDLLAHLIDKSLVVPEWRDRADRYGMLRTLRQFALEELQASGEAGDAAKRHAEYFVGFAEEAEPKLKSKEQRSWQARVEDEHNNIQAALEWLVSAEAETVLTRPKEEALRLAGALWRYWEVSGHLAEGRAHLQRLLRRSELALDPVVLARAHLGAGVCSYYCADYPAAISHYENSAALYRSKGDRRALTWPLTYLGWLQTDRSDFERASALLQEAVEISRELVDLQAEAWATARLGILAFWAGDPAKGAPLLERALALSRDIGDDLGTVRWLLMLGHAVFFLGQADRSEELLQECASWALRLGDRRDYACAVQMLAVIEMQRGDPLQGLADLRESLMIFQELGDVFGIARSIFLYSLTLTRSRPDAAVRFGACSDALCVGGGFIPPRIFLLEMDQQRSVLMDALGGEAFRAIYEAGWGLSVGEAVAELLARGED